MDDDLTRLRAQIDQIDQQILALLTDRLAMAEQVAAAKQNGSPVFRPEREAQLLSRLTAQADPSLHPVIQAVWRAIISAAIARQRPEFTIGATTSSEQTARLFAASQLTVQTVGSPAELCQRIETAQLDIGIIEVADLAAVHSSLGLDKPVKIIAGLPLFGSAAQTPSAFVLAAHRPEASDQDRYLVYDPGKAASELIAADQLEARLKAGSGLSVLGICTAIG